MCFVCVPVELLACFWLVGNSDVLALVMLFCAYFALAENISCCRSAELFFPSDWLFRLICCSVCEEKNMFEQNLFHSLHDWNMVSVQFSIKEQTFILHVNMYFKWPTYCRSLPGSLSAETRTPDLENLLMKITKEKKFDLTSWFS